MKKHLFHFVALFSLSLIGSLSVAAQETHTLKANIPFSFSVREKTLPAGAYHVILDSRINTVRLDGTGAKVSCTAMANNAYATSDPRQTKLIFRRYGNQYFLAQVWQAGERYGYALPKSRAERDLIKDPTRHLAQRNTQPELVAVLVQ